MESSFDRLTRELTAFDNAEAMVTAVNYRPTIRPMATDRRYEVLADAYDLEQTARGDERRAYRGTVTDHFFTPIQSVRLNGVKHGSGQVGDWLRVIWEINTEAKGTIGEPLACYWAHGGWTEEYPEFRVVLVGDEDTSGEVADIVAFTDDAAAMLRRAVHKLGLGSIPVEGLS